MLMKMLHLADTKDPTSLDDAEARYEMAMRYAETGIHLLWERLDGLPVMQAREEILAVLIEAAEEQYGLGQSGSNPGAISGP